jgi:hypothetical protein
MLQFLMLFILYAFKEAVEATFTSFAIPTPPAMTNAPVVEDVDWVVEVISNAVATSKSLHVIVPCVVKSPVLLLITNLQTDGAAGFEYTKPTPFHEFIAKLKFV